MCKHKNGDHFFAIGPIELKKILTLKNAYSLFSQNIPKEIILNIFPQFKYYERLKIIKPKWKSGALVNSIKNLNTE